MKRFFLLCLILLAGSVSTAARAATPGAALPGQIERQFQEPPRARSQAPPLAAPLKPQPMPDGAEELRLSVTEIVVDGMTVYREDEFQEEIAPLRQREISLADLYRLADRLTHRYRTDGYLLSQVIVPQQVVDNGIARLQAVEGFIDQVHLTGVENDLRGIVATHAERIRASRPLAAAVLEREMLLINDLPGAFARAVLAPSRGIFGAADLTIVFTQSRVSSGGASLNNRGGELMGPMRYQADIQGVNLLGLQDRTQFMAVTAPSRELRYFAVTHEQPAGSSGGLLKLDASSVRAIPDELSFIPLNIETRSDSVSFGYSQPILRSRAENLYLRGTLAAHNGETELFGVTESRDDIRALRLGATYDLADVWDGINLIDIEYSHGLQALGASDNGDPFLSRFNGKVDFKKLSLYAARLQNLSAHWSLLAAFSGQYAWDNLLASELYSFGGEQFGRAYDPSELVGDHGAALKIEPRYTGSLQGWGLTAYTLYGYYDVGKVWQREAQGLSGSESAAAAGAGLRLNAGKYFSGVFEIAKPLTRDVAAEGDRKHRLYLGLSARF